MNAKNFFVDALTSALELGIATPFDVIRHVTPDVLGEHLPRPLWARLFTACLGAPKVDAQLVVETVGVSNLCEHMPSPIIWGLIAEIGARSLGQAIPDRPIVAKVATEATSAEVTKPGATPATGVPTTKRPPAMTPPKPLPVASPPPVETKTSVTPAPPPPGPSIPAPGTSTPPSESVEAALPARARTPTGQRFRQTSTNIGRLAANQRRPQASAAAPEPPTSATQPTPTIARGSRSGTEMDVEIETEVANGGADWRNAIAIEDDQLVDWSSSEETQTSADDAAFGKRRP